jgi:hypothetical protein
METSILFFLRTAYSRSFLINLNLLSMPSLQYGRVKSDRVRLPGRLWTLSKSRTLHDRAFAKHYRESDFQCFHTRRIVLLQAYRLADPSNHMYHGCFSLYYQR